MTDQAHEGFETGIPWEGIFQSRVLGLSYIGLAGGVFRHLSPRYGEGISFVDIVKCYDLAAATLVKGWLPLCGQELVFLRKHLDLTQDELAAIIGSSRPTIARWEARAKLSPPVQPAIDKPLPNWADFSIRMLVAAHLGLTGMTDLAKTSGWRRARLPAGVQRRLTLHHDGTRWTLDDNTFGPSGSPLVVEPINYP